MQEPSALSLLPPVLVVVLAVFLRRPILSLLIGALFGLAMLGPTAVLANFADISLKVMQDETIAWLILVCGGFGALIALLVRTGGASAFAELALKFAKGQRSSLVMTFVLGVIIFIDDYLNALTVGETMKRITDKFKISREMLAYVVDSTAAPICVLVPLSTWAVFFGGLLVDNNVAPEGQGIAVYIQAIPYMLYAWFAVIVVLLVSLNVIPAFGPMKKAQLRAMNNQIEISNSQYTDVQTADEYAVKAAEENFETAASNGKLYNFLVPIVLLVAPEVVLCVHVPLFSRKAIPAERLGLVLWPTVAGSVYESEGGLRVSVPLLRPCADTHQSLCGSLPYHQRTARHHNDDSNGCGGPDVVDHRFASITDVGAGDPTGR